MNLLDSSNKNYSSFKVQMNQMEQETRMTTPPFETDVPSSLDEICIDAYSTSSVSEDVSSVSSIVSSNSVDELEEFLELKDEIKPAACMADKMQLEKEFLFEGSQKLIDNLENSGLFGSTKKCETLKTVQEYINEDNIYRFLVEYQNGTDKNIISEILNAKGIDKQETVEILNHVFDSLFKYAEKSNIYTNDFRNELGAELNKFILSKSNIKDLFAETIARTYGFFKEDDLFFCF